MNSKPQLLEVPTDGSIKSNETPDRRGIVTLVKQLRKRKVCRTAISYILILWLNLQLGDVIFPMMGLPEWTLNLIVIIGVMGFPVVLILAWAFQITADGIVLDSEEHSSDEVKVERQLDTCVNVLLLLSSIALSILLVLQFISEDRVFAAVPTNPASNSPSFVVSSLTFNAANDDSGNVALASGIQEELRHQLIVLDEIELLPDDSKQDVTDNRQRLSLSGSSSRDGDTVHVLAHLIDLSAGRYLTSVTFDVEVTPALTTEFVIAQRIIDGLIATLLVARG